MRKLVLTIVLAGVFAGCAATKGQRNPGGVPTCLHEWGCGPQK